MLWFFTSFPKYFVCVVYGPQYNHTRYTKYTSKHRETERDNQMINMSIWRAFYCFFVFLSCCFFRSFYRSMLRCSLEIQNFRKFWRRQINNDQKKTTNNEYNRNISQIIIMTEISIHNWNYADYFFFFYFVYILYQVYDTWSIKYLRTVKYSYYIRYRVSVILVILGNEIRNSVYDTTTILHTRPGIAASGKQKIKIGNHILIEQSPSLVLSLVCGFCFVVDGGVQIAPAETFWFP